MLVHCLVEGFVDEAVARRLLAISGHQAGVTYGIKGWTYIAQKASDFDRACVNQGLLTLVDFMDTGETCPPAVVRSWVPHRSRLHVFRVVENEIEAWILADREGVAKFLGVALSKIPLTPEKLADPKQYLINVARSSRQRAIREGLVPQQGYSASEGPLYSSEISRFVATDWDAENARRYAPSLDKCLIRLTQLRLRMA